jgi:hypothetical protein
MSSISLPRFSKNKQRIKLLLSKIRIFSVRFIPLAALTVLLACSNDGSKDVMAQRGSIGECRAGGAFAFVAPTPAVAISNDPDIAVVNLTLDRPGVVQIVHLKTGEATNVVPPRDDILFQDIALSPDGKYLATILTPPPHSGLGEIWISSLADGTSKVISWSPGRLPKAINFSADGGSIVFFRDVDPTPLPSESMPDECRARRTFSLFEVNLSTGVESGVVEQAWELAAAVWPLGTNPNRFLVTAGDPLMRDPNPNDVSRGEFWTHSFNRVRSSNEPRWRGQIIERGVEPEIDKITRFLTTDIITDQPPHGMDTITLSGKLHSVTTDMTALVQLFWSHGYMIGSRDERNGFYLVRGNSTKKLPSMDLEGASSISPNGNLIVKINRIVDNNPAGSSDVIQVFASRDNFTQSKVITLRPTTKSLVLKTDDRSVLK